MANNKIQVKRTNVAGRTANVTSSGNSQFIDAGEFALNMADGILYSSNGSALITVGANLVNQRITNSFTIDSNKAVRFQTVNTSAVAYFIQQNDDNFVFYTTNTSYGARPVYSIFANSNNSELSFSVPVKFNGNVTTLTANGTTGTAGQVLTSNGSATYWSSVGGSGTVTSVASGNGISGGPITTTGTLVAVAGVGTLVNTTGINVLANNGVLATAAGVFVNGNSGLTVNSTGVHVLANSGIVANSTGTFVLANSGIISNSTGIFVNGNTGTVVNSTGVFVNATYIGTLSANNASFLGGTAAASFVQNTDSRTLSGNLNFTGTNTTVSADFRVVNSTANVLFIAANGNIGIGNTTPTATIQVYNATGTVFNLDGDASVTQRLRRYSTDTTSASLNFVKGRGTTASPTTVSSADVIGATSYLAYDGTSNRNVVDIRGAVETYTGTDDVSGRLTIWTRPTGAAGVLAERLRIAGNGNIGINNTAPINTLSVQGNVSITTTLNAGNTTITGFVDATTHSSGTGFTANSTLVNAAAINIVGQVNTATLYATTSANIASAVQANSTGIWTTGTVNGATISVGTSFIANTSRLVIGAAVGLQVNGSIGSSGQVLTSNGTTAYWATASGGGGVYMKGGTATIGSLGTEGQNLFRVNANTLNFNTTIATGENAQATGPISVASGITLTVESGARVSIV